MRFVPTRVHALLDYVLGVIVAGFPYVAGFADHDFTELGCVVLGLGLLLYSALTNYEYGAIRFIPL
ncbi:MAG: hypothetical protein JOZ93_09895, partial [Sinobacteraceae bacterium]|nr:hypothetical protein [Nevskiaceae bacterium]